MYGPYQKLADHPNKPDAIPKRDPAPAEIPVRQDARHKLPKGKTVLRREKSDRQAIERGEDEGMIVGPG
jgi:hypothetical protein